MKESTQKNLNNHNSEHSRNSNSIPTLSDSHCHLHMLDLTGLEKGLDSVMKQAESNGLRYLLCVGTRIEDIPSMLQIANRYSSPDRQINIAVGLHPNEKVLVEPTHEEMIVFATHTKVVAIGETGLDYYRTEAKEPWQIERFELHIQVAKQLERPLIIHSRAAKEDTLATLKTQQADKVGGVFHCFTEDWETAKAAMDLGFYISFSGIVTFKNATELQAVAKQVPLDRLLIETDCPYLAPVPHRGKTNLPSYVKHVAEFLAELRQESFETIAEKTTENYLKLFM